MVSRDSICIPCAAGKTSLGGATECTDCPSGMISFTSGSSKCFNCQEGSYSSSDHTQCLRWKKGLQLEQQLLL